MKLRLNYVNLAYFQSRSSSKDLQLKYYKFTNNKISIPEILPDCLINWLKEFEFFASENTSQTHIKKTFYIDILIYLILMVLITLVL